MAANELQTSYNPQIKETQIAATAAGSADTVTGQATTGGLRITSFAISNTSGSARTATILLGTGTTPMAVVSVPANAGNAAGTVAYDLFDTETNPEFAGHLQVDNAGNNYFNIGTGAEQVIKVFASNTNDLTVFCGYETYTEITA